MIALIICIAIFITIILNSLRDDFNHGRYTLLGKKIKLTFNINKITDMKIGLKIYYYYDVTDIKEELIFKSISGFRERQFSIREIMCLEDVNFNEGKLFVYEDKFYYGKEEYDLIKNAVGFNKDNGIYLVMEKRLDIIKIEKY